MEEMTEMTANLSDAERKVIYLMRNLKPYEKVEIKLHENREGELCIVSTGTTKEIFQR